MKRARLNQVEAEAMYFAAYHRQTAAKLRMELASHVDYLGDENHPVIVQGRGVSQHELLTFESLADRWDQLAAFCREELAKLPPEAP